MDVSRFRNVCFHSPNTTFSQPAWLDVELEGVPLRQQDEATGKTWSCWVNRVMKWWKQMMQKSANSLGTKITHRLMYFQKYLGESMLFFQAIYIPFPKSKGFLGGPKNRRPGEISMEKTVQYTTVSSKKIDSQVSYLWKLYQTNRWREISPQVEGIWTNHNSCGTVFFGGGHQWSCLTRCLVLGVEFRFISVSVVV